MRADRPDCRRWVVRIDWDYGALPRELAPHVTEEADHVIVHSELVQQALVGAGRSPRTISTVPHGVDDALCGTLRKCCGWSGLNRFAMSETDFGRPRVCVLGVANFGMYLRRW